jgi:putative spermidine/putrescine transport system permease protein
MQLRWGLFVVAPFAASLFLLLGSQLVFLSGSLHTDLSYGRVSEDYTLANFVAILTDPFYLQSLFLTFGVSAATVVLSLVLAFPVGYTIARMRSRVAMLLLATVVLSSFISVVIKALGLIVLFASQGPVNTVLMALGLVAAPVTVIGNVTGVVIGLLHYTLGFAVMLTYGIVTTIPRSLEEAAQVHGAGRWRVYRRIILPLAAPGLIVMSVTVFNLCMGAFTSAAVLGKGTVLTLPVLIWRTILLQVKYGMGSALSAVLLLSVLAINVATVALIARMRRSHLQIA